MKKIFLITIIAMLLIVTGCIGNVDLEVELPEGAEKTVLTVWGIHCGSCVKTIEDAVSAIEGVIEVDVNMRDDKVTVIHDSDLDIDIVKDAITSEGFNIP